MDLLAPVLLAAAVAVILLVMVRGMRPRGGPGSAGAHRWSDLRRFRDTGSAANWIIAAVATLALVGFATMVGAGGDVVVPLGAFAGLAFAVVDAVGAARVRAVAAGVAGALGILSTVIALFAEPGCTGSPFALLAATFALLVVVASLATLARVLTARPVTITPLAAFGALEVIGFLAGPFGVSPFVTDWPGASVTISLMGAIGLGLLVGVAPRVAIGLGGVAITLTGIGIDAGIGGCTTGPDASAVLAVAGFAACYGVFTLITGTTRKSRA